MKSIRMSMAFGLRGRSSAERAAEACAVGLLPSELAAPLAAAIELGERLRLRRQLEAGACDDIVALSPEERAELGRHVETLESLRRATARAVGSL
jgi:hypothetical protein